MLEILAAWLLADFITGIIHWAQDRLLLKPTRFAFLNRIKADNDLHHSKPAAMTQLSLWGNIDTTAPWAWPLALLCFIIGFPMIVWLTLLFASFGNIVHRFAHMPRGKVPRPIRWMQATGLFITFKHHHAHHFDDNGVVAKENSTIRFCPMTNWLNPVLDWLGFFPLLERIFKRGDT